MQSIAAHADIVVSVDPNGIGSTAATPNDSRFSEQWSLNNLGVSGATTDADIDAPEAWDITTGSSAVTVAVIDTGVDFTHPDLSGASWVNTGEIAGNSRDDDGNGLIDDLNGWDFVNGDNDPTDDNFHGTHVAGILGARGNNGIGIAGVAWNCRIMALKVMPASGRGGMESDLINALNYALMKGAHIVNISLGGYPQTAMAQSTLNALEAAGILVVCAAGNDGRDTDAVPNYPSCYPNLNIISVANSDDDDTLAGTSNFGLNSVDVAAPGTRILSTFPVTFAQTYQLLTGTSMASPHVAGVAALVKSLNPSWTAPQLRAAVLNNADRLTAFNGVVATGARLNAFRAIVPTTITLTAPNGGGSYERGRSLYINWSSKGPVGDNVSLELLKGGAVSAVIANSVYNVGYYPWPIPTDQALGTDYRIRVNALSSGLSDESDSNFEITSATTPPQRIEIWTLADLQQMTDNWNDAQHPRDGYYVLMADIDANATSGWNGGLGFKPIGNGYNDYFRGTFDGQGHQITRLYCKRPTEAYAGMFAVTMDKAVIKNLSLELRDFRAQGYANRGGTSSGAVGGIAGENSGLIQNCRVSVNSSFHMYVTNGSYCGAIVGANTQTGKILNCAFVGNGAVEARGTTGGHGIGGIAGANSGLIRWCWTEAAVTVDADVGGAPGEEVGGIAGRNDGGSVLECESRVAFIDGHIDLGGVVGANVGSGTVQNCSYRGSNVSGDDIRGGVIGANTAGTVENCYLSGGVASTGAKRGSLIGENNSLLHDSYWNTSVTPLPATGSNSGTVSNCVGRTATEMMQQVSFTNWDFVSVWNIDEGVDSPTLRGVGTNLIAPSGVTASTGLADGIHVSWSAAVDATYYLVSRSDAIDGPREPLSGKWLSGLSFVDTTATPLAIFYYWVQAATTRDGGRSSEFSAFATGSRALPPPFLTVRRQSGSVIFSWPSAATGFTLVSITNLGSTNWISVSPSPVIVNGLYTVTNSATAPARFYRLQK